MWPVRHGRDSTASEEGRGDSQLPLFWPNLDEQHRESFITGVVGEVACQYVLTTVSVPAVCFVALWLVCGQDLYRPSAWALAGIRWEVMDGGYAPTARLCPSEGLCQTQAILREEKCMSSVLSSYACLHNWLCDSSFWLLWLHLINWRLRFHPTENKVLLDVGRHIIEPPHERHIPGSCWEQTSAPAACTLFRTLWGV